VNEVAPCEMGLHGFVVWAAIRRCPSGG
jgi:hypothetical protein